MEKRITIRLNDETIKILDKAALIWSEHAENQSALIRTVVAEWWRGRYENGSKSDLLYALLYLELRESSADLSEVKEGAVFIKNAWKKGDNHV